MKIFMSTAVADQPTALIRQALAAFGHTVLLPANDCIQSPHCDVVIVLVSAQPDADRLVSTWEQVGLTIDNGIPVLAVSLAGGRELPAAVAAIPHEGSWIRLDPNESDPNLSPLLARLSALEAQNTRLCDSSGPSRQPGPNEEEKHEIDDKSQDSPESVQDASELSDPKAKTNSRSRFRQIAKKMQEAVARDEMSQTEASGRIFVSYSRGDKLADDVVSELQRHGYDVWIDKKSIPGAADWRVSIQRLVQQSDVFLLLLSPNVVKDPKYVWVELGLAQKYEKRIVPIRLRRTPALPEGFDFALSGLQFIDLYPDFAVGIARLIDAIGSSPGAPELPGVRARIRRASAVTRRFAHEHEVGRKIKSYGAAAAAGAVVVGVAMGKAFAEQQEAQRRSAQKKEALALEDYVERTSRLLNQGLEEIKRGNQMTPKDYREEFRPVFMHILGQLEGIRPDSAEIVTRHNQLVQELRHLLDEFDSAMDKAEKGDWSGFKRSIERLNEAWVNTMVTSLKWLRETVPADSE